MEQEQISSNPPRPDQDKEITAVWDRSLPSGDLPPDTVRPPIKLLDLTALVKTSQEVSGEIVQERLVRTLLTFAIEHAGAERALLVLPRGDGQRIEAEATAGRDTVEVRLLQAVVTPAHLPESILHHVIRTQDSVLPEDTSVPNQFSADEYILGKHTRSILCLPLVKQAKLIGVLYLENHLTPSAFTPAWVTVLKLLASQVGVSLDNAQHRGGLRHRREPEDRWRLRRMRV